MQENGQILIQISTLMVELWGEPKNLCPKWKQKSLLAQGTESKSPMPLVHWNKKNDTN